MNRLMIKCPECKGKTRTIAMGRNPNGALLRQKECMVCGHKFFTSETIVEADNLFLREWHVGLMRAEKENQND